jgi:hypothetical protein
MAVGSYTSGGVAFPLVYTWGNVPFAQQFAQLNPGQDGYFSSVSCQSPSFCAAAGGSADGSPALAEIWNGTGFTQPPGGIGSQNAFLRSVSCAAAQSGFCVAVGTVNLGGGLIKPYVESYTGAAWVAQSNASNGQFVVAPSNTNDAGLSGVYCLDARSCHAVGNYYGSTGDSLVNPWGAQLTNSGWSFEALPPSGANAGFGLGNDIVCPSECWGEKVSDEEYAAAPAIGD